MKIAIVPVGYNRKKPLQRLLRSICEANYGKDKVDLIVSLDKSDKQKELVELAESIKWQYGEKKIRTFKERQGLRQHILQCGDLTNEYDAVVILEDDLIVSKGFYDYVHSSVEYYKNSEYIGGISLYSHKSNPGNGRLFEAANNGYDVYLMKYAQSWGQCWTSKMWRGFREWYKKHENYSFENSQIPRYVAGWNSQSWLKYYIAYCVECNKYFVYPYLSLTTNATEVGEHNRIQSTAYQVPILLDTLKRPYLFGDFIDLIKYDAYYEREFDVKDILALDGNISLDLYGMKYDFKNYDYVVSTRKLSFKIIKRIALQYRPHEMNIVIPEKGEGIYVYDLHESVNKEKDCLVPMINYELKAISSKFTLLHGLNGLKNKILMNRKK